LGYLRWRPEEAVENDGEDEDDADDNVGVGKSMLNQKDG
jgi:hypothetical protein